MSSTKEIACARELTPGESARRKYGVMDVSSPNTAISLVRAIAPDSVAGMALDRLTAEEVAEDYYEVEVTWKPIEKPEIESSMKGVSVELGVETQRLMYAYSTVKYTASGSGADDRKNAIAFNSKDREIQGVDVFAPDAGDFRITQRFMEDDVDGEYFDFLNDNRATVNNATFWGYDARCVLFKKASIVDTRKTGFTSENDGYGQIGKVKLTGLKRTMTDAGYLYLTITKSGTNYSIGIYKNSACTQQVALISSATQAATNTVAESGGSGIGGTVYFGTWVADVTSASPITIECPARWEITMEISIRQSSTHNFPSDENPIISNVVKPGFDVVDIEPEVAPAEGKMVPGIKAVRVHQAYPMVDFDGFKLGNYPFPRAEGS